MCGIAGIVSRDGSLIDPRLVQRMIDPIEHRGPDGVGVFISGSVGLGHRRLAILDLSEGGRQPMVLADGSLTITFNGEIYNYLELRSELAALGHAFRSGTDTEVLLAAYAEWGAGCVERLNGMWSFAIFDVGRRQLFCSRDRFGEKPFYFLPDSPFFAFSSEIRQLLPVLGRRVANRTRVLRFLIANLAEGVEDTFFEGVRKLPAGHNLTYKLDNGSILIERYYDLENSVVETRDSDADLVERVSLLLRDSIALRLRADVRVGTCLSGGLDSSSVAAIASGMYGNGANRRFSAITAISEQKNRDESGFASMVVARSNLDWHTVTPRFEDFRASIDDVVVAQEEPFASASIVMQFFVMREARRLGIAVLLDGQGGDETFLGYERYFAAHYLGEARKSGWVGALRDMLAGRERNASVSPTRLLGLFAYFNFPLVRWMNYRRRHAYIRSWPMIFPEIVDYSRMSRDVRALQIHEISSASLPALLRYEDKNSMRHAVETRLPFLDHRLVELALALPGKLKLHNGWTKHALRLSSNQALPTEVTWRSQKLGFEAPESIWFREFRSEMLREIVASPLLAEMADIEQFDTIASQIDPLALWRLFSVARWARLSEVTA